MEPYILHLLEEYAQQAEERSTLAFSRYMDMCTSGIIHGCKYSPLAIEAQKIRADEAMQAWQDAQALLDMAWQIAHKTPARSLTYEAKSAKNAVARHDRRTRNGHTKRTV